MASKWIIAAFWLTSGFGAFAVPVVYLVATRCRGRLNYPLLFGGIVQLCLSLLVFLASELDYRRGNMEAYYWGLLLIPLNFGAFLYYGLVFTIDYNRQGKDREQP
jgi:hypothetical protein